MTELPPGPYRFRVGSWPQAADIVDKNNKTLVVIDARGGPDVGILLAAAWEMREALKSILTVESIPHSVQSLAEDALAAAEGDTQ